MNKDVVETLGKLGLRSSEAKIYLACLRSKGGLFVHEITKASGVKRSTVDMIVRRLMDRNWLAVFREGRRRKFVAASPESLLFDYERGVDDFRALLPMLAKLALADEQTRVTFHEGAKGVKAVFDEINLTLRNKPLPQRVCYSISSGRDVEKIQPKFRRQFIDARVKNRIAVRMIAPRTAPDQTWPSSAKELRATKMFDGKKYPLSIELDLADDKAMLLSFRKPVGGITIQSKPIVQSLRSVFNLLWDLLGPIEPEQPV